MDFRIETIDLQSPFDIEYIDKFLKPLGFDFDKNDVDYTMVLYNLNHQIVGTGSYKGKILKYVAVNPNFRESSAFADIVTHLNEIILKSHRRSFVFTKPENCIKFEGLGYKTLAVADPMIALLELGYIGIENYKRYITQQKIDAKTENVASIVMNCNPFTNGHLFLVEKASKENEVVYLFVVEEDKSIFPFEVRWELIRKGIKHLKNVVMLRGADYIVSSATFPSYFLKNQNLNKIIEKQTELDVRVFCNHIVKALGIKKRYVGTEDYCKTTAAYNKTMKRILPEYDVEFIQVERKCSLEENEIISASKVREALRFDKIDEINSYIPITTYEYLKSPEASYIIRNIKLSNKRH